MFVFFRIASHCICMSSQSIITSFYSPSTCTCAGTNVFENFGRKILVKHPKNMFLAEKFSTFFRKFDHHIIFVMCKYYFSKWVLARGIIQETLLYHCLRKILRFFETLFNPFATGGDISTPYFTQIFCICRKEIFRSVFFNRKLLSIRKTTFFIFRYRFYFHYIFQFAQKR